MSQNGLEVVELLSDIDDDEDNAFFEVTANRSASTRPEEKPKAKTKLKTPSAGEPVYDVEDILSSDEGDDLQVYEGPLFGASEPLRKKQRSMSSALHQILTSEDDNESDGDISFAIKEPSKGGEQRQRGQGEQEFSSSLPPEVSLSDEFTVKSKSARRKSKSMNIVTPRNRSGGENLFVPSSQSSLRKSQLLWGSQEERFGFNDNGNDDYEFFAKRCKDIPDDLSNGKKVSLNSPHIRFSPIASNTKRHCLSFNCSQEGESKSQEKAWNTQEEPLNFDSSLRSSIFNKSPELGSPLTKKLHDNRKCQRKSSFSNPSLEDGIDFGRLSNSSFSNKPFWKKGRGLGPESDNDLSDDEVRIPSSDSLAKEWQREDDLQNKFAAEESEAFGAVDPFDDFNNEFGDKDEAAFVIGGGNDFVGTDDILPVFQKSANSVPRPANHIVLSSSLPSDPIDNSSSQISFAVKTPVKQRTIHKSITHPLITPRQQAGPTTSAKNTYSASEENYLTRFDKKQLKAVNKAKRTKPEIASEMILNMNAELVKQFGLTNDKLSAEFAPSMIRVINTEDVLKENILTISVIRKLDLEGVTVPPQFNGDFRDLSATLPLFTWSRRNNKQYSAKHNCFFPLPSTYNQLTDVVGIYYEAELFFKDYQSGHFLSQFKKLKQELYPNTFKQFILVLKGHHAFLQKAKRKINREYTNKVRTYIQSESQDNSETNNNAPARKKKKKADELNLTVEQIEAIAIDLQINHAIHFFPIHTTSDFLMWLKSITYAIGFSFYENITDPQNQIGNFVGTVKGGNNSFESLQFALEQFKYVTKVTSQRVTEKYPSLISLYKAAVVKKRLGTARDGKPLVSSRVEGPLVKLFNSDNPDELIHED